LLEPIGNRHGRWAVFVTGIDAGRRTMKRIARGLIAAGIAAFLIAVSTVAAEPFDSKKFFDELGARGGSVPSNFDGTAFFEDLKQKGMTSANRIGPKKFFDELQSRGVILPSNFDHSKFLEDCKLKGIGTPEMVDMKK
jgi:hypothetical protein